MSDIPLLPVNDHSSRDELSAKAAFSQGIYDMLTHICAQIMAVDRDDRK